MASITLEPLIDPSMIAALTGESPADTLARAAAQHANAGDIPAATNLLAQACDNAASVPVLFLAFQFHFRTGNIALARDLAQRRITLAASQGDNKQHARAWSNLGLASLHLHDTAGALAAAEQAIALSQLSDDPLSLSRDQALLAQAHEATNNWTAARDTYLQALQLAERTNDPAHIATKLANLGDVYKQLGDATTAATYWRRALPLLAQAGKHRWHAECEAKLRGVS
jgi:tetratricopeptide (TPR) repeat protein